MDTEGANAVEEGAASNVPQYRFKEQAYVNMMLVGPNEKTDVAYYRGIPGPHMVPLNEAARAQVKKYAAEMKRGDPIAAISVVSEEAVKATAAATGVRAQ